MDQKDDEEENASFGTFPGWRCVGGLGLCIIFHIPRGGGRFLPSLPLPVHHPDNALKDGYPPRNEPGTSDRGRSLVENLAWIYSNWRQLGDGEGVNRNFSFLGKVPSNRDGRKKENFF